MDLCFGRRIRNATVRRARRIGRHGGHTHRRRGGGIDVAHGRRGGERVGVERRDGGRDHGTRERGRGGDRCGRVPGHVHRGGRDVHDYGSGGVVGDDWGHDGWVGVVRRGASGARDERGDGEFVAGERVRHGWRG